MANVEQVKAKEKRTRKPPPAKRQRSSFTVEQKIKAVTVMLEVGTTGPLSREAQQAARMVLGANVSTSALARWQNQYKDKVIEVNKDLAPKPVNTAEIVRSTQASLVGDLIDIQRLIVGHIKASPDVVGNASLRDSMVSLGISADKLEQWLSISPDARDRWNKLQAVCMPAGLDPLVMFDDFLTALQKHIAAKQITAESTIDT